MQFVCQVQHGIMGKSFSFIDQNGRNPNKMFAYCLHFGHFQQASKHTILGFRLDQNEWHFPIGLRLVCVCVIKPYNIEATNNQD